MIKKILLFFINLIFYGTKRNSKKIKVLIGCYSFKEYTGSELYVFELAKKLIEKDYEVYIVAKSIGNTLTYRARKLGIKVIPLKLIPSGINFDIIHCQHKPIVEILIKKFPAIPKVCSIHSEVYELEDPVIHPSIYKYIAIRPEIKNHIISKFGISSDIIEVIYNPIDELKFTKISTVCKNYILFVGTIDNIRRQTIFDLIEYSKINNKELWLVGKNHSNYISEVMKNTHVRHFKETFHVEKFVAECYETAGVLLGSTTIEGWLCGKSGWIYNIDKFGNIINKTFLHPPYNLEIYKARNIANQIEKIYFKREKNN